MPGVAGAPVSFGVFELATDPAGIQPEQMLAELAGAGYHGVDLGPVGWLGRGDVLRDRLHRHRLSLAGGYIDLPLSDDAAFTAALPALDNALSVFVEAAATDQTRPPLPTLADSGSPERQAHPGGGPGLGLDEAGWRRLATNLAVAVRRVRQAGLEPTFHHHIGTYVETADEIAELLARTEIGLTLDTGHLLLAGGDPVAALTQWGKRINHVHVKDAHLTVLREALRDGADMREVWRRGVFPVLGGGDLDLAGFMDTLLASGYDGWVVVEQDLIPAPADARTAVTDQRINREVLRQWLP